MNTDVKPWFGEYNPAIPSDKKTNSHYRFETVENRLASASNLDDQMLMTTLSSKDNKDHPVCRANNERGAFTFASVIMTLDKTPVLKITAGPPDESEYQTFDFKN